MRIFTSLFSLFLVVGMSLINVSPADSLRGLASSSQTGTGSSEVDAILKKSVVMKPGFQKLSSVPPYWESVRSGKRQRKAEREKTTGPKWFGLKAGALEESVNDLEIIRMRSGLGSLLGKQQYYRGADRFYITSSI